MTSDTRFYLFSRRVNFQKNELMDIIPYENTKYELFTTGAYNKSTSFNYTSTEDMFCLCEDTTGGLMNLKKDESVRCTFSLSEITNFFIKIYSKMTELNIIPPMSILMSGSYISARTNNNFIYVDLYITFFFHYGQYLVKLGILLNLLHIVIWCMVDIFDFVVDAHSNIMLPVR